MNDTSEYEALVELDAYEALNATSEYEAVPVKSPIKSYPSTVPDIRREPVNLRVSFVNKKVSLPPKTPALLYWMELRGSLGVPPPVVPPKLLEPVINS